MIMSTLAQKMMISIICNAMERGTVVKPQNLIVYCQRGQICHKFLSSPWFVEQTFCCTSSGATRSWSLRSFGSFLPPPKLMTMWKWNLPPWSHLATGCRAACGSIIQRIKTGMRKRTGNLRKDQGGGCSGCFAVCDSFLLIGCGRAPVREMLGFFMSKQASDTVGHVCKRLIFRTSVEIRWNCKFFPSMVVGGVQLILWLSAAGINISTRTLVLPYMYDSDLL